MFNTVPATVFVSSCFSVINADVQFDEMNKKALFKCTVT